MNTNKPEPLMTDAHLDTAVRILRDVLARSNGPAMSEHGALCGAAMIGNRAGMVVVATTDPMVLSMLMTLLQQTVLRALAVLQDPDASPRLDTFQGPVVADADRSPGLN